MGINDGNNFDSKHFRLQQLADGVWAAVALDSGGAMANAGIEDLGDRTLVFDTFMTPQAADDLRAAVERLTGRPVGWVVNSHWHDDHVRGNQVFAGAPIVATARTRELLAERGPELLTRQREEGPAYQQRLEAQLEREGDAVKREELARQVALGREVLASLPALTPTLPNQTFDGKVVFHGPRRIAELMTFGGGHTESDALLHLPDDGILFTADLVVIDNHPWLGHGDPEHWLGILDRIDALGAWTIVPGHGPIGTAADIAPVRQYLADVGRLALDAVRSGASADGAAATPIPAPYSDWGGR